MNIDRRQLLLGTGAVALLVGERSVLAEETPIASAASPAAATSAPAGLGPLADDQATQSKARIEPRPLVLPADFGSHPAHRTEWWYLTGWAETQGPPPTRTYGFQVTFFRSRTDGAATASRFSPGTPMTLMATEHCPRSSMSGGA